MEEKRAREGKSLTYCHIASKKENWSHLGLEFSSLLLSSVFHSERVLAALRWGLLRMDLSFSDSHDPGQVGGHQRPDNQSGSFDPLDARLSLLGRSLMPWPTWVSSGLDCHRQRAHLLPR